MGSWGICSIGTPPDGAYGVVKEGKTCNKCTGEGLAYYIGYTQYVVQLTQDALARVYTFIHPERGQAKLAHFPV